MLFREFAGYYEWAESIRDTCSRGLETRPQIPQIPQIRYKIVLIDVLSMHSIQVVMATSHLQTSIGKT